MNDFSSTPAAQLRIASRSMGVKLLVVCALAMLLTIPALLVGALVEDRTHRAADVIHEISGHVGGPQTFLGPTLAIPYTIPPESANEATRHGMYLVFPARGSALVRTSTQERRRSLFKVPVFEAELKMDADFDLTGVPSALPPGATLDWPRSEIIVGVTDPRGALADALLTSNGKTSAMVPAEISQSLAIAGDEPQRLVLFGAKTDSKIGPNTLFSVSSSLHFSGAQRIALLAYAKTTHLSVQGEWPNPSFDGGFLPVSRTISDHGFQAEWSVPFIARGVRADGPGDTVAGIGATALGVSFIEVADPYQSVNRSLKYVPLFLGLLFLSYFVFEVTTGKRVHPAQYILVGIAQIIFYLLLLSLAERIGFDLGFLLAGIATVSLLAANAGWIFKSRAQGFKALVVFGALYSLIYLLLRLEDNALLIGAIASFFAVAATMYFTRRIDWYSQFAGSVDRGSAQSIARDSIWK